MNSNNIVLTSLYKYHNYPSPESYPSQIAYFSQLRLNIPYKGPIIFIKLYLLIKYNRTSVKDLILACLGIFLSKAISPK